MGEFRRVRVALAVFDDIEDLVHTVERLRAIGIGASDLWAGVTAGDEARARELAGSALPVCRLEAEGPGAPVPVLVRGYDCAIHRWAAAPLHSLPQAVLESGGAVLIVRIGRSTRQLTVSEVLLASRARVVQLHDMVPEDASRAKLQSGGER